MVEFVNEICLREGDFDKNFNLKACRIFEFFQDAASNHVKEEGFGSDELLKLNLLWIAVRENYEVVKMPNIGEHVRVQTWFCGEPKIFLSRGFKITDSGGNTLVNGNSQWGLLDKDKRTLVPMGKKLSTESDKEAIKMERIPLFEDGERAFAYTAIYDDIDSNGHVNNARYAAFAASALKKNPRKMQIDFHKELLLNGTVEVYIQKENERNLICGKSNGEIIFAAAD